MDVIRNIQSSRVTSLPQFPEGTHFKTKRRDIEGCACKRYRHAIYVHSIIIRVVVGEELGQGCARRPLIQGQRRALIPHNRPAGYQKE